MLYFLCRELDRSTFDLTICFLRRSGRFQELITHELADRVRIYKADGYDWLPAGRIMTFLKNENFDLIHAFGFRSDLLCRMLSYTNVQTKICSTIPNPDLPNLWFKKIASRWISQIVSVYWADCHYRSQVGTSRLFIPPQKVKVIYPGVSCDLMHEPVDSTRIRSELHIPVDAPFLCSLGNLRSIKGHPSIIEASRSILKEFPQAVFVMIGEDWTNGKIVSLAKRLNVIDQFRFIGFHDDPIRILRVANLLLHPSVSEGLPRAILEAMSIGLPVIASEVGGIPEVIENGVNGFLIAQGDIKSLAEKTKELLSNPALCKQLAKNAQHTIRERFSLKSMIFNFESLYRELCFKPPVLA